uniref:SF3 helicase domain-containing protein n=1 Tax=viral metagenome TaxID=1070528 RepID=A0A6C0HRY7_9ZZZZ
MASQYKNLDDFLAKHKFVNSETQSLSPTHTRIGNKTMGITGGSYTIPEEKKSVFHDLYYRKVFHEKKNEYLTEKQISNGAILVDLDLKFSIDVDKRIYTSSHIEIILSLYLDTLKSMLQFVPESFPIFIMEKKDVNRCVEKEVTKDGIHIIIGIKTDHVFQGMLRKRIVQEIPNIWDDEPLPITNSWDNVVDDSICKGSTNWQVYGSRKPGHAPYILTQYYKVTFDERDSEFSLDLLPIVEKDVMNIVSAQYNDHPLFAMKPEIEREYNNVKNAKHVPKAKRKSCIKFNVIEDVVVPDINDIKNKEQLEIAVNALLKTFDASDYSSIEAHEYTQILPESYYEDGSHANNCRVAFALKHTDERLFLSWVMLRSKNPSFDYDDIPNLLHRWKNDFNKKDGGLTKNSIIYWAKKDAYEKYVEVKNTSLQHYIDQTLNTTNSTDYDVAKVLHFMNKGTYCCTNIGSKLWYVFENHRWKEDKRMSIRNKISEEVHRIYSDKMNSLLVEIQESNENQDQHEKLRKKIQKLGKTCEKLKKTSDKNNIFREAMEIFCNDEFLRKIDGNKYLMCFKNGVVDFKKKEFRAGIPEDYLSKCTNINYFEDIRKYMEKGENLDQEIVDIVREINEYMSQLYPIPELCDYMWAHLASCLIGENINQTCSFYVGSGSNGKSSIVELMSYAFGDYKGVLPISIVTEKRVGVGGTNSELIALKGVRYAVMQESSKGMKLNEGILKELTGGDTIVARQLFKESESFTPQFTLVVCTNNLPDIEATDDGTWRRIKSIQHHAKFVDNLEDKRYKGVPFLFKKNKNVKDKLKIWAPIFMSMLVYKVFQTEGIVDDCEEVLKDSTKYRESQDHIASFMNETILEVEDSIVTSGALEQAFKLWFRENLESSGIKQPKLCDLKNAMTLKYTKINIGKATRKDAWQDVKLNEYKNDDIGDLSKS